MSPAVRANSLSATRTQTPGSVPPRCSGGECIAPLQPELAAEAPDGVPPELSRGAVAARPEQHPRRGCLGGQTRRRSAEVPRLLHRDDQLSVREHSACALLNFRATATGMRSSRTGLAASRWVWLAGHGCGVL